MEEEHLPEDGGCQTPNAEGNERSEGEAAADSEQDDQQSDRSQSDSERDSDDERGERDRRKRRFAHRWRRNWTELATFDRTAMLDSEVEAGILAIATEKMQESGLMEWPEIKRADIPSAR